MGQVYEIQEPEEIELLLQVNGKMHGSLKVPFNASGEETNLIDQLQEERCKLAAELAAARAQEPLTDATKASCALGYEECSHRCGTPHVCCDHYVEPEPIATPIPPVRDPLSDEEVDALGDL